MENRENEWQPSTMIEELLSRALLVRNRPPVPRDIVDRVPADQESGDNEEP